MSGVQKGIKIGAICLAVFIIVNIFSGILYGLSFITDFSTKPEKTIDYQEKYNNVKSIYIDSKTSSITIKPGLEFKIEAKDVTESFTSKIINTTLKIKENNSWFKNMNLKHGKITIYIPEWYTLDNLSIDNGAGEITLDKVVANNLTIDQGAGVFTIKNSNFSKAKINGGAGKLEIISSKISNLNLDAGVGSVLIEATLEGNNKIDCGVGKIDVTINGRKEDYTLNIDKGIGSIVIDNESQKDDIVYGNGNNILKIDGGVGSIEVKFNENAIKE